MSDTESILPEILIDDTADEYVETDDEPGTPSPKTRPPANEIFYQDEEPPEDEPAPPAVEPTFTYVKPAKPKRQALRSSGSTSPRSAPKPSRHARPMPRLA